MRSIAKWKFIALTAMLILVLIGADAKAGGPTFGTENPECAAAIARTIRGTSMSPATLRCAGPAYEGDVMRVYIDTPGNRLTAGRSPFHAEGYVPIDYQTTFVYDQKNPNCMDAIQKYVEGMDDKDISKYACYIDVDHGGDFVAFQDTPGNRASMGAWTRREDAVVPPKIASQLYEALRAADPYFLKVADAVRESCAPIDVVGSEAVLYDPKPGCVLRDPNVLMLVQVYFNDRSCNVFNMRDKRAALVLDCMNVGTKGIRALIAMPDNAKSPEQIAREVNAACGKPAPNVVGVDMQIAAYKGSDKCREVVRSNAFHLLALDMDYVENPESHQIEIRKPGDHSHVPVVFFTEAVAANK